MASMLVDIVIVRDQEQKNLVKFLYLFNQVIIKLLIHWGFEGLALRGKYCYIPNFLYYLSPK